MGILEKFIEATREMEAFENHPAKELELEERLLYLNGLALVMNVDNEINDDEKEYLRILLKSFEMSEDLMDEFIRFSDDPDKATIQSFVKTFRRRDIAKLFIFDALMMTRRDGRMSDQETMLIDSFIKKLEITKGAYAEIYDLFCHIKNREWKEARSFFSHSPINVEYFQHLLDYHGVSLADILRDKVAALQKNLGFKWVEAKYKGDPIKSKARKHLIAGPVTYARFIRFLQFGMDNREIRVLDRKVANNKKESLMDLNMAKIGYDPENRVFSCDATLNDKPVSGFTPLGATAFAESVNCSIGYGKKYSSRSNDVCFPLGGGNKSLKNELVCAYNRRYYRNKDMRPRISSNSYIRNKTSPLKNAVFRIMK